MPWNRVAITPLHLPFNDLNLTYDPGRTVEVEPILDLDESTVWRFAPLTKFARRELPLIIRDAWHVRSNERTGPCAIVLKLRVNPFHGRIVAATPERATLGRGDRQLVVTPELVLMVRGSDRDFAFGHLADLLEGTRPRPRLRYRPASGSADELAALSTLSRDR